MTLRRRTRWSLGAAALAAVAAAVALLGELYAASGRVTVPAGPPAPQVLALPAELVEDDAELGYRFRPNASTFFRAAHGDFAVHYEINEIGLREPGLIFPGPPPPQVLFLGDEYAEGRGVMREATFIQEAQRRLRGRDGIDRYTRLLNAGMTGYGAAQALRLGRRLIPELPADAVVFVFSALMPVADFHFLRGTGRSAAHASAARPGDALELVRVARAWRAARSARAALVPGDPRRDRFAAARDPGPRTDALYAPTFAHIAALARLAREHGAPFLLLHLPLPHQVAGDEWRHGREAYRFERRTYPAHDETLVRAFCAREGLRCLLAGDMLRALARRTASPVYYPHDHTLTKVGHRALVEFLTDELAALLLEIPLRRESIAAEARRRSARRH